MESKLKSERERQRGVCEGKEKGGMTEPELNS